jgi:hypothetical protein
MLRDFVAANDLPTADEHARFLRAAGHAEAEARAKAQEIAETSRALLAKHNPEQQLAARGQPRRPVALLTPRTRPRANGRARHAMLSYP